MPMPIKHRLFVLTDIENEPDDTQSLVRLLLYSNEVDIEGLVATTSTWIRTRVCPDSIRTVIRAYDAVRPKLLRISSDYPTAESLLKLVGEGVVNYGMEGVGEEFDSTGSELLIQAVDKADERTLHVALWGGASVLAQALWRVRKVRSQEEVERFVSKVQVYGISDQDDAGPWIRRHFPKLRYIVSVHGENVYMGATWIGFASNPMNGLPGATKELISASWLKENIQVGPLGSQYPNVIYGMEGDTPSYLSLLPVGLGDPDRPDYGGWGGRYKKIYDPEAEHYHDAVDRVASPIDGSIQTSAAASIWRWRDQIQYDFAARVQWTIEEDEAKLQRPPVVIVDGDEGGGFIRREARVGETLEFDAGESYSPNGGEVKFSWFQYKEIDSVLPIPMEVPDFDMHGTASSPKLKVTMPKATTHHINDRYEHVGGRTYHVILAVTSNGGKFPLTRYRRILVHVKE